MNITVHSAVADYDPSVISRQISRRYLPDISANTRPSTLIHVMDLTS